MQPGWIAVVHVAVGPRVRAAQPHEARSGAGTPRDGPAPRGQVERCRYPSLRLKRTWRPVRGSRQCEGSSSYIQSCHRSMATQSRVSAAKHRRHACRTWPSVGEGRDKRTCGDTRIADTLILRDRSPELVGGHRRCASAATLGKKAPWHSQCEFDTFYEGIRPCVILCLVPARPLCDVPFIPW